MSLTVTKEQSVPIDYSESEVYAIVQSNRLIKAQYLLSTNEHKLLESIISMINPTAEYKKSEDEIYFTVSLNRSQISDLTGIANKNLHKFLLGAAEKFDEYKVTDIKQNGIDFEKFRLISYSSYIDGIFTVKFTSEASRELYNLSDKRYTKYLHDNLIKLKNKYAIRLYRQIHCLLHPKSRSDLIKFDIKDLWFYLGLITEKGEVINTRYTKTFSEFKTRVLEKALKDISNNTELNVSLSKTKRDGRKIRWVYLDVTRQISLPKHTESFNDPLVLKLSELGINPKSAMKLVVSDKYKIEQIERNTVYLSELIDNGFVVREPEKMLLYVLKHDFATLPELVNPYSQMYRSNPDKQQFLKERIIPAWADLPDETKINMSLNGIESDEFIGEYREWLSKKATRDMFS